MTGKRAAFPRAGRPGNLGLILGILLGLDHLLSNTSKIGFELRLQCI